MQKIIAVGEFLVNKASSVINTQWFANQNVPAMDLSNCSTTITDVWSNYQAIKSILLGLKRTQEITFQNQACEILSEGSYFPAI